MDRDTKVKEHPISLWFYGPLFNPDFTNTNKMLSSYVECSAIHSNVYTKTETEEL